VWGKTWGKTIKFYPSYASVKVGVKLYVYIYINRYTYFTLTLTHIHREYLNNIVAFPEVLPYQCVSTMPKIWAKRMPKTLSYFQQSIIPENRNRSLENQSYFQFSYSQPTFSYFVLWLSYLMWSYSGSLSYFDEKKLYGVKFTKKSSAKTLFK
jgi:hypothetical protein